MAEQTSTIIDLRRLCGEFNAGAYMQGREPNGMSKDDALEWATQIIDHVPALLDVAGAAQGFAESHERFHPDFWASDNCAGCSLGKRFSRAFPSAIPQKCPEESE